MTEPARKPDQAMTILDACRDPALFAPWFERGDWSAWFAFLAAVFGLDMDEDQRAIYKRTTGRTEPPRKPFAEGWLVVGRRGGKSFITALVAVWLAAFRDYREFLQPGERGTVLILAADRKQARVIFRYVKGLIDGIPMLATMKVRETTEEIELSTGVSIEIGTASFRGTRGYTVVAALLDEVAFWRTDDSANPDDEIINAIQPGMSTIPNSMMLGLSSPYAKRGSLYQAYRQHYGRNSDVLVWQADTRTMNPSVPQRIIDRAYAKDEAKAKAEYGAQFRNDIESFVSREAVDACIIDGRIELPFVKGNKYRAFTDPSGGSKDAWTLAIAHKENDRIVIDAIRSTKPPFSPDAVVKDYAGLLDEYRIKQVTGDRYGGEFPRELFRKHGIDYKVCKQPKSELYKNTLPAINSGKVELVDNHQLVNELVGLERRTARGGRDSIDHSPGSHDDLINSVAGVIIEAKTEHSRPRVRALNGETERVSSAGRLSLERFKTKGGFDIDDGIFR